MNEAMKIVLEVNMEAESFYDEAQKLGIHAAHALGKNRRSQLTGLESIAESALKTSDIFDYIKKQIARSEEGKDWRKVGPDNPQTAESKKGLGERLKTYLEQQLVRKLDGVCFHLDIGKAGKSEGKGNKGSDAEKEKAKTDRWKRQDIHLRLMREFIRQMVVQYEYQTGGSRE